MGHATAAASVRLSPALPEWLSGLKPIESVGWLSGILTITPDMASVMLSSNGEKNRSRRNALVEKYARAMRSGGWVLNGEPLIFDNFGKIMSAQHRLEGCLRSGKPFTTLVIYGVDTAASETVDIGTPHTINDIFKMGLGIKEYISVPAACTLLFRHDVYGQIQMRTIRPSIAELRSIYDRYAADYDFDELCRRFKPVRQLIPLSTAVALFIIFSKQSVRKASEFMRMLGDGATGTDRNHPILILRNTILKLRRGILCTSIRSRVGTHGTHTEVMRLALLVIAWNAFRDGKSLFKLSYNGKEFPRIGTEPSDKTVPVWATSKSLKVRKG